MPRALSGALETELAKTITSVGYLLQINASEIRRWSNLGDVTFLGVPWISVDFDLKGLRWDPDRDPEASLSVQNLDSAVAAWFLEESLADITVDVYQFAAGALADDDVPQLARLVFDGCQIKLDRLEAKLVGQSSLFAYSPRRRVESANGFNYGLPKGAQIVWGSETYIVEPENG